jgi:hypothetical protein
MFRVCIGEWRNFIIVRSGIEWKNGLLTPPPKPAPPLKISDENEMSSSFEQIVHDHLL